MAQPEPSPTPAATGDAAATADAVATVDAVLSTTRAVRRRLDLERPVPDELLLRCIDVAEQAPSGAGQASRRWLVIRDPEVKEQLAELYRRAGGARLVEAVAQADAAGTHPPATTASAAHLAEHLAQVPALVLVTIWGIHDGSGNPGLFDSVIQAAWSFCLALRVRGLGSAWTTLHLAERDAAAELLGLPAGVSQIVLLPVAWTIGTDFHPVARRPASEVTYLDHWGHTATRPPASARLQLADGPGATAELDVAASPAAVWAALVAAPWSPLGDAPAVGEGVVATPPSHLAWRGGAGAGPDTSWRIELDGMGGRRTRLRLHATLDPADPTLATAIAADPGAESTLIRQRVTGLLAVLDDRAAALRLAAEA